MSIDLHYFRDLDAQALRRVRFVVGDVPGDTDGEPTPGEAPERAVEDADDSDASTLQDQVDAKVQELQGYLNTLNDYLDSLEATKYEAGHPELPRDHPFYFIDDPKILAEGAQLLEEAIHKLSTSEQGLQQTLDEFHAELGPIRAELDEALLASFSLASTDESPPPRVAAAPDEVETVAEGTNYTVKRGDTMYDILTKQLANDALRSKVTTRYGLSPDLALKDLVLQLFAHTDKEPLNDRLKQDLIYPGDRVFFNESGSIQYFRQTSESPTPAPPAPAGDAGASDAVVATDIDSDGDGLAQLDDEVPAEEGEGERDRNPEADQTDVIRGLDVEPEPPLPIGSSPETSQERQLREDFYAFFKEEWEKTRSALPAPYSSYEVEQLISSVDVDETSPHGKGTFTLDGPLWLAMIQNSPPIEGYSAEDLSALTVETLPNYLNTEFHALVDRFEVEFSGRHPELSVSFDNLYTFESDPSDPSKIIMTINFDSVFDSAAGAIPAPAAESAPAEPAAAAAEESAPEATPEEVRLPKNLQDFMAPFPGLSILEKDFAIKTETNPVEVLNYPDPNYYENVVTVTLSRFSLRGKIHSAGQLQFDGKLHSVDAADFTASGRDKDTQQAYGKALANLVESFKPIYDLLIAEDEKEHRDSNEVPEDFPALKAFLDDAVNSDVHNLKVKLKPQNPETPTELFRCPITVTFEVDGYPGQVELRWPKNPEIEGGTDVEALINAYAAVMRDLPNAVVETRRKAADRDETKLRDADGKVEGPPVGAKENLDYFLNSLEQKPNGTIAFELFDPVTGYYSRYPCKITLSSKGVLKIESFRRPALTFQLSFTATPYGKKTEQEFHGIRLLRTDQPPAPGVKGHGEVSQNPGHPWIDQITNDRGQVMARDIVLSEQFLYDVTRKILQQNALVLDDSEQPLSKDKMPSDFSGQYVFSNNFDNIARITEEDMRLRTGGERMWIQKVE